MKVKSLSFLLLSCLATFSFSSATYLHRGQQVENYHVFYPKMIDLKRNQVLEGVDTRLPSRLRSTQGHYIHRKSADVMMNFFGTEHVLKLTLNEDLIHPNYHVIYGPDTIDENGNVLRNISYGTENCYYGGHIEGLDDTFLAVSTCSQQMEGILRINNEYYVLEPKNSDNKRDSYEETGNDHVVFKNNEMLNQDQFSCGVKDRHVTESSSSSSSSSSEEMKQDSHIQKRGSKYLEVLAVNDFARVNMLTAGKVQADTINIFNTITQTYATTGFNLDGYVVITLIGQYVPSSEEWLPGVSNPDSSKLLESFKQWRTSKLGKSTDALGVNDNAQLLSGRDLYSGSYAGNTGYGYIGSLCGDYSCAATEAWSSRTTSFTAIFISHEMGHNFGSEHDGSGNSCSPNGNIMAPAMYDTYTTFSSCSKKYIQEYVPKVSCLDNIPTVPSKCGNYILDDGEQCDFGLSGTDCCNGASSSSPCTWKSGAQCDNSNLCCSGCKFRPTTYLCRSALSNNPCDLNDYCTADGKCPDQFKADTESCGVNSVCSSRECVSRATQCEKNLEGYTMSYSGDTYIGPYSECSSTACELNCLGTSRTNSQKTCLKMERFSSFKNNMRFAAKGIPCDCNGAAGKCPGDSTVCDCSNPTSAPPTNPPTNPPTRPPTNPPTRPPTNPPTTTSYPTTKTTTAPKPTGTSITQAPFSSSNPIETNLLLIAFSLVFVFFNLV